MLHDYFSSVITAVVFRFSFHLALALSACLSPFRKGPANIWKPHRLHVTVALWCSESFPSLIPSREPAFASISLVCLSLAFSLVWFQGMPWINMLFLVLFLHLSVVHSGCVGSVCPDPKEATPSGLGHISQPEIQTITRVGNGISGSGNISSLLPSPFSSLYLTLHTPWGGSTNMS